MSAGASVLLLNRTFIWPVTFPCSGIVCYTRSVFVGHARTPADPSLPHAALMHCVVSHTRCCFPCPHDCLFALQYTHSILNFLPPCNFLSSCPDIGSWLQLFGFQLHNVVPGFPKPEVGRMEQTYELMKAPTKMQDWDSSKVSITPLLDSFISNTVCLW